MTSSSHQAAKFTAAELNGIMAAKFPGLGLGAVYSVEETAHGFARLRLAFDERMLRPGGTMSGPAMFGLADVAMYVALLAAIGPAYLAVTMSMTINFLSKPAAGDLIAEARLLKLGKRLAVGEIALYSEGRPEMVAHATSTYSIPASEVL